jgi:SpoIIAA-like
MEGRDPKSRNRHDGATFEHETVPGLPARSLLSLTAEPAAITMSMTLRHERDNVYRLDIRGTLHKHDFERCQAELIAEMNRVGAIRLLFLLERFDGWDPGDDWQGLTFYVSYGDSIERIAIVGDERWRSETLMFAGADLRKARVEFFPEDALAQARAWLAA